MKRRGQSKTPEGKRKPSSSSSFPSLIRFLPIVVRSRPSTTIKTSQAVRKMEHGTKDVRSSTFCLTDEDHTLANSVRFTLNQDPRVSFCGYSIPHPADAQVNIRVQTTGDPAVEVMNDALQDLKEICEHVRVTFNKAVVDFKMSAPVKAISIEP